METVYCREMNIQNACGHNQILTGFQALKPYSLLDSVSLFLNLAPQLCNIHVFMFIIYYIGGCYLLFRFPLH